MKKGFTLIELLAIIIVLGVILAITVPAVQRSIVASKTKLYNVAVVELTRATKKYVIEHSSEIAGLAENGIGYVTINNLINSKYVDDGLENPKTGENFNSNAVMRVARLANGSYKFDFYIDGQPALLSTKFTPQSASANGATGTYTYKNDSNYFVGANPNNWIEFGQVSSTDETPLLWRIVKSDDTGIKIVYDGVSNGVTYRMENYGMITVNSSITIPWDTTNSNKWLRPASLNTQLLNWYNSLYIENESMYVKPIKWCIGAITWNEPTTTAQFLQSECVDSTAAGGEFKGLTNYAMPVGLIKPSEYISTSSAATCTGSYQSSGNNYGRDCGALVDGTVTNFLYKYYMWWLANAAAGDSSKAWIIDGSAEVSCSDSSHDYLRVRPMINLKAVVNYDSGTGSFASPYHIK